MVKILSSPWLCPVLLSISVVLIQPTYSLMAPAKTYHYFAMGSNMLPATMTALRGITPLNATAGVLADYQLAFNIAGSPLLEPSAASARRAVGEFMHGVLYELTEEDFARVGSTEGVPFVYRWEPCQVVPYQGDGKAAGEDALTRSDDTTKAYTLSATKSNTPDFIPTSPSYLKILQQGAAYWKMDRAYQKQLGNVPMASNLLIKDGLSGSLLRAAEFSKRVVDLMGGSSRT